MQKGNKPGKTKTQTDETEREESRQEELQIMCIIPQRDARERKGEMRWQNNRLHVLSPQAWTVKASDVIIHT